MHPDIKHIAFGMAIGMAIVIVIFFGLFIFTASTSSSTAAPLPPAFIPPTSTSTPVTPSATPTVTFTPTITPSPTATFTETPSPTPTKSTAEQMLNNGEIILSGPLSADQQIKLFNASLEFIALTTIQAKQVGVTINGRGYGSPSLICGPLSLAIMQNAGLIEYREVEPHDFWLLNPYVTSDRQLLNLVFPPDKYENTLDKTPINKFDWRNHPLLPGDFLFIRHGTGGNFDHMLVVTRVDNFQRVYTVTNFETPNGFIINEVMLYDPADWTAGLFHKWTEKKDSLSGSTGFGGFEIWRKRMP